MTATNHVHKLTGCSPVPLAGYLKALGILRLVAEQVDPSAQGWWAGDVFHLRTRLSQLELLKFFISSFRPTPIVAPWNGGSGFYSKDNQTAIKLITNGAAERFASYRTTLLACRSTIAVLGLKEKPDGEAKDQMLVACRSRLPDEAVQWLDAAYVLTAEGPKYPPLLGTGGNDGRLEFTNNFMQRLLDLVDAETGQSSSLSSSWWEEAFFPTPKNDLQKDSILGQFDPGAVERSVNPWDYVMMIEGSLVFASAAVKRHELSVKGILSYPFCVRSAGIGYGSSAASDEESCRAEFWLPLWNRPCGLKEIEALFSEGRAQVHGRAARTGVDFARAVSTLGTDRGIEQFMRFGFHARNGLAYFAVPLGRFIVRRQPQVDLLNEEKLDRWLDSFRRAASSDMAPSSARRALNRLEDAILKLCQKRGALQLQAVLIGLGEAEAVLARSPKWREEAFQRPVPVLPAEWLTQCDDGSNEFRLAASLAGIHSPAVGDLRQHLEPVEVSRFGAFWSESLNASNNVVWSEATLDRNLIAIFKRRCIEAVRQNERVSGNILIFPGQLSCSASLGDISAFVNHDTNDERIAALLRGLILLDWLQIRQEKTPLKSGDDRPQPDAIFTTLKLCHLPYEIQGRYIPLIPEITRLAAAGRLDEAMKLAIRRLTGSSLKPVIRNAARSGTLSRRIAASLLFPISFEDMRRLAQTVLAPEPQLIEYAEEQIP